MASSWGTSWGTSWLESWGGVGVVVPPVEPPVVGGGGGGGGAIYGWGHTGTGRGKKRRNRTEELFREIEATIRAAVVGEEAPAALPVVAASPLPVFEDQLAQLAEYARENEALQERLTRLQMDLAQYAAQQREAELREDEESWMLLI